MNIFFENIGVEIYEGSTGTHGPTSFEYITSDIPYMVLDEINTFTKVINYLSEIDDVEFDSNKLTKALKQTQFKELQKLEKTMGFDEASKYSNFFRSGTENQWQNI